MNQDIVQFYKADPLAKVPTKNPDDCGYDLYSIQDVELEPGQLQLIDTGIIFKPPYDCFGHILPRSSLSLKDIWINAGVVDRGYRGRLKIIIKNAGNKNYQVKRENKIAQLVLQKVSYAKIQEVNQIDQTDRQDKGFGSTGR